MTMELVDDPPASNAAGTPTFKEYTYFGGQVIAEKDQTANPWTDYIYAAGKKIAKVNPTVPELHIHGTDCASCNAGWVDFAFSTPAIGYTIRQGDTLSFLQKQQNVHAGLYLMTPYANTWPSVLDQNGDPSNVSSVSDGLWHPRFVDLSVFAGQPITSIGTATEETPPPGLTWDVYYADVAIQSKDGTVTQIFSGQTSMGFGVWGAGGEANLTASVDTVPTEQNGTIATGTHYYLADELGTTQLEFSSGGWHIWRGEFAPFGQELDTQTTLNHYKFTGKERDTESGLDYFGARYYGSNVGRFMSPDWAAKVEPIPYSKLDDPQSLNLYAYVHNNPLNSVDVDGHDGQPEADPLGFVNGGENIPANKFPDGDAAAFANYMAQTKESQGQDQKDHAAQQQSSAQGQSQSSGTPGVVTGAAADHQRAILLGMLGQLVPGDKDLDKELGSDCVAHGGNCTFSMTPDLKKEVNAAMGASPDFPGSTFGAHSREGFSPSLHHNHDGNEPDRLHIDHFNGRSVFGFLPHIIVDVSIGSLFYGSQKVFSY